MSHDPIPYATLASQPRPVTNRRGWLIAFGILSILLGTPSVLVAVVMLVGLARIAGSPMMASFLPLAAAMALAHAVVAAAFLWIGIDSIRCRRWVRPVVIALSWSTLVPTLLTATAVFLYAHDYDSQHGGSPGFSEANEMVAMAVVMLILGVMIPAGFIRFFTSAGVRDTLAAYDPSPSWTEWTPLPVFAGCVALALGGLLTIALALVGSVPVFGVYVTGTPAVLLVTLAGIVMIAGGVLIHLGHRRAHGFAVAVVAGGFASAIVTLLHSGMAEFYRQAGFRDADVADISRYPSLTGATPIVLVVILATFSVGYLSWMRRRMAGPDDPPADRAYPSDA